MRTLVTVIALILLASLVLNGYFIWDRAQAQKERFADNSKLNQVIEEKNLHISTLDTAINYVLRKARKDSAEYKVALMRRNEEIKGHKSTIAKLRPQVQAKIDSFPDLRQFVALQDSIISKQDSLIRSQDLFCALQIKDFNEILTLHKQKFIAQAQISDAWMDLAESSRQEAKNQKRKKRFWQWTAGITTGIALYIAVKPD